MSTFLECNSRTQKKLPSFSLLKLMEMQGDFAMQTKVCKQKDKRTIALVNFLQNLFQSSNMSGALLRL